MSGFDIQHVAMAIGIFTLARIHARDAQSICMGMGSMAKNTPMESPPAMVCRSGVQSSLA